MRVIALFPRPCKDAEAVMADMYRKSWFQVLVCLSSSMADLTAFRETATKYDLHALILCGTSWQPQQAASVVECDVECNGANSAAVLIFDGPGCEGFAESNRSTWNEELGRNCQMLLPDVQVFEYSESWRQSPPRIR